MCDLFFDEVSDYYSLIVLFMFRIEKSDLSGGDIGKFMDREWVIADTEHYGGPVDFNKRTLSFVARDECGEILGFVELIIEADLAKIESLLVGSKHRRKGVGKFLLDYAYEVAVKEDCKKIYLETNVGWEAEKFYVSQGYEVEARLRKHILGQDGLILSRFL